MGVIIKMAWDNIWRSKTRSWVVILSIVVGVWAVIFLMALTLGMGDSYVKTAIRNQFSHIQLHHPRFQEDQSAGFYIPYDSMRLLVNSDINSSTARLILYGMLSTGHGSRGVKIKGILPYKENRLSGIADKIVQGHYLTSEDQSGILISEKLTQKFKVTLKSRVVLTFQDSRGEMKSSVFRIAGIYNTGNAMVDENQVLVNESGIRPLIFADSIPVNAFHEIAIEQKHVSMVDSTQRILKQQLPGVLVENYREIAPDLAMMESQIRISGLIFIGIFMLALIFGIINTMLMAVLERYRELGMLQAIGMEKTKVFGMIVLETIFLSIVGVPIGFLLGWISVSMLQVNGLDVSIFSKGNEQFGIANRIFPILDGGLFIQLAIAVAMTALLASIYPAIKAIKLSPVVAIRKI